MNSMNNNYITRATKVFNNADSRQKYLVDVKLLNQNILFNFGYNSIGNTVKEQVSKLSDLFADEIPSDFIVIAIDDGGNVLVANLSDEHIYYYDYNYNFTHMEETLEEPDNFDVMNAYNSYLVFETYAELFNAVTCQDSSNDT